MGKLFTLIAFAEVLNVCMKGGSLVMPTVNLECGAVCISVIYVVLNKFSLFCETSAFAILKHYYCKKNLFGYLLTGVYDKY